MQWRRNENSSTEWIANKHNSDVKWKSNDEKKIIHIQNNNYDYDRFHPGFAFRFVFVGATNQINDIDNLIEKINKSIN